VPGVQFGVQCCTWTRHGGAVRSSAAGLTFRSEMLDASHLRTPASFAGDDPQPPALFLLRPERHEAPFLAAHATELDGAVLLARHLAPYSPGSSQSAEGLRGDELARQARRSKIPLAPLRPGYGRFPDAPRRWTRCRIRSARPHRGRTQRSASRLTAGSRGPAFTPRPTSRRRARSPDVGRIPRRAVLPLLSS
jgi:hypothetical protein